MKEQLHWLDDNGYGERPKQPLLGVLAFLLLAFGPFLAALLIVGIGRGIVKLFGLLM